jgi:hypothetical protein
MPDVDEGTQELLASAVPEAGVVEVIRGADGALSWRLVDEPEAVTAAGGPLYPPAAWFDDPQLNDRTPLTITDDGRVFGHVATWLDDEGEPNCHIGFDGVCITPPRSVNGYRDFNTRPVRTAEGGDVHTGRLTYDTGHAAIRAAPDAVLAHYDNTGTVAADIRCGEDEHGIWAAGALRPDMAETDFRVVRAASPSGDWRVRPDFRRINGHLEMQAVLLVNTPGFRQPQAIAATAGGQQLSLIATGMPVRSVPPQDTQAVITAWSETLTAAMQPMLDIAARDALRRIREAREGVVPPFEQASPERS